MTNNINNNAIDITVWLNGRKINHSEGRTKLAAELAVRGISKEDSAAALDDFFETNNEAELCRKAYEKCLRIKKDPENIIQNLKERMQKNKSTPGAKEF